MATLKSSLSVKNSATTLSPRRGTKDPTVAEF